MRRRVGVKLAAIWLAVAIPLSFVLAFSYYQWYSAQISLIEQQRLGYAQLTGTSFELLVEEIQRSMQPAGELIAGGDPSSTTSTLQLQRVLRPFPADHLMLADVGGRVVGASDRGLIGQDVSGDVAFKAAMAAPDHSAVEPSRIASGGVVGFHVAQGIETPSGRFDGVMLMLVDVRKLARQFRVDVEAGGISVVDSAGQVVFQNEDPRFAENRAQWGDQFPFVREALEGRVAGARDFRFPLGGSRIGAFVPIERIRWAAGSSVDAGEALAPFYRTIAIAFPIGALLAMISLVAAMVIARSIRGSLHVLVEDAERIGSGDLGRPVRTDRADEIGDVARSLEAARLQLEEARRQADQQLETTRLLLQASSALTRYADLRQVLQALAEVLLRTLRHKRVWVFLWSEAKREIELSASAGESAYPPGTVFRLDQLSPPTREALGERRTTVADYDALSPDEIGFASSLGLHLVLLVPIVRGKRLIGLLAVDDVTERRDFTEREIALGEGIAAQAAVAIENARLYEEERVRRQRIEALQDVSALATSSLEPRQVADRVLRYVAERLGVHVVTLWAFNEQRDRLFPVGGIGFPPAFYDQFAGGIGLDEPYEVVRAYREGRPVVHENGADESVPEPVRAAYSRYGAQLGALLVLPLTGHSRIFGAITLAWSEPRKIDEDDVAFFSSIAGILAVATENARLYDESQRELVRTTVLKEVATAASSLDPRELSQRVLETLRRRLGVKSGAVYRIDEGTRMLRNLAVYGYAADVLPIFAEVDLDEDSISGQAVMHDEVRTYTFDRLPPATRRRAEAAGESANGWVAVPVHVRGRVIGSITLVFPAERRLEEEDLALFRSLADQLGVAMENATLFERQTLSAKFGELLNELNAEIAGNLEFDEIMERTVVRAGEALGTEAAVIEVRADGEWPVRYVWNLPGEIIGRPLTGEAVISRMITRAPQVLVIEDVAGQRDLAESLGSYGIRAMLAVPLVVRGETTGVLVFPEYSGPRRYDAIEIDFARKLGAAVSGALETARLYEVEHRVAQTLQQALLALPDRIEGLSFAHDYRSATQMARVGGDFYDLFELEHGLVGIIVGDISGKGINAAVLTSLVKNTIRARATQDAWAPAEAVKVANDVLLRWSPSEVFATIFYGVLDCRDGRFVYCSGGHPTSAIVHRDRERGISKLESTSALVGAFRDVPFADAESSLDLGDVLFLYTDGLTEARNDGELYGEERVFAALSRFAGRTPAEVVAGMVDDAVAFSGGRLSDDLAILALERTPVSRA